MRADVLTPWQDLACARMPGGGALALRQRGGEFEIRIDGAELMTSRGHGSEAALAELACVAVEGRPALRMLIGGLGMGYTLRAALDRLPSDARVVVAELVPEVVAWNQGPLAALARRPLADPRVEVRIADIDAVVTAEPSRFDTILLDVDNGPAMLVRDGNAGLYEPEGLARIRLALRPGGVLAVWSADPCDPFARRLHVAGFAVRTVDVPARGTGGGPSHTIFLAQSG